MKATRDVLSARIQLVPRADFLTRDSDILTVIDKEGDIQKIR